MNCIRCRTKHRAERRGSRLLASEADKEANVKSGLASFSSFASSFLLLPLDPPHPLHLLRRLESHLLEEAERDLIVLRRGSERRWSEESNRRSPARQDCVPELAVCGPRRALCVPSDPTPQLWYKAAASSTATVCRSCRSIERSRRSQRRLARPVARSASIETPTVDAISEGHTKKKQHL